MRSFLLLQPLSAYMWLMKCHHASCYRDVGVFIVLLAFRRTVSRQGHGQASNQSSLAVMDLIRAF